jgi:hypothetical protein
MKICSKCGGVVEPAYEKYGRRCRACRTRDATERNRKNPARARAAGARYREAHREDHREANRLKNWKNQGIDLTVPEYEAMLKSQGGKCAICRTSNPGGAGRHTGTFHADHDHKHGHVRGLLCSRCNRGIGSFFDSPALLRAAATYLDRNQPKLRLCASNAR